MPACHTALRARAAGRGRGATERAAEPSRLEIRVTSVVSGAPRRRSVVVATRLVPPLFPLRGRGSAAPRPSPAEPRNTTSIMPGRVYGRLGAGGELHEAFRLD